MTIAKASIALALSLTLILALPAVFAHGDEDHGEMPTSLPTGQAIPTTETHSEDFELLAQLRGTTLVVYLDGYADNRPVEGASIEVESGAFTTKLKAVSAGIYQADASALARSGEHALVFTVMAGAQSDLLDAVLSVNAPAQPADEHASTATRKWWWTGAGLAALFGSTLLIPSLRSRLRCKPNTHAGSNK